MGFKSDITEYQDMLHEYDRRGEAMRNLRALRNASYMGTPAPTKKKKKKKKKKKQKDYYTSVNGTNMTRDEYATYTQSMYEANGEEYPGQMYEALAGIYSSPM